MSRKVFVIHGRNEAVRRSMFEFLRAIDLQPLEWPQLVGSTRSGAPFIGQVLDAAFQQAKAVVALFTPDDIAYLKNDLQKASDPPHEKNPTGQARPNVLFETGMALGRDPDHTVIVEVGDVRPFSDIAGRHVVRLNNDAAKRMDLTERLKTCGCSVDTSGKDWLEAGDFSTTGTAFRIEATSSKTHFVSQTVELLEDMSSNLRSCIDDFGCQFQLAGEAHPLPANRIVIYRAFPFEFSTQLFSTFRQNPRFRKAFGIYTECLRKIIEEGTDRIGDWWDFSIYGKLDDPMADSRTITAIRNLYVAGGQDNDPFVDRENPPDTSYIYTNSAVRSRGILLIGELDLEKMRDDPEVDELGNVMPRIKQWHHGYWMMDITYSNGEVKFENCLITSNQDVLKAMRLEFEAIKKRSKLYKLNSDMTAQKKEQLMREIKSDLMCGDGTENEL